MTQVSQFVSGNGGNLMTMSYSTVSGTLTGGTSLSLASAPTFTVTPNCWVVSGGVYARILSVATQQSYTLHTSSLSNGTANYTILQPVYTLDLYNDIGSAGNATRIVDTFSQTVSDVVIDYDDSTGAGNIVFAGGTPNVVCLGSTSSLDTYVVVQRSSSKNGSINDVVLSPAAQNLVLTFLPNVTSGSGSVNLLGYICLFLRDSDVYRGGIFNSAFGFTDGSGTPYNCTFGVSGGLSTITVNGTFPSYVPGVNPGTPYGDVSVLDCGVEIPRFTSGITDASLPYYTETSPNQITLWGNFDSPAARRQISVVRRFGTNDTSDANATFIANLQLYGFLAANAVVGSSAQVADGVAGYTTIAAAYASLLGNPGKILVLPGTYTENPVFTTAVTINGFGISSIINGTVTLNTGSNYSSLKSLQILNNVTVNSNGSFIGELWLANGFTITNNGTGNSINYIVGDTNPLV
jgi:hypothetical protein